MNPNTREQMYEIAERNQREEVLHEIELSDRLSVRLAELKGSDETAVVKMLGKDFTATGAGALRYRNALLSRSVKQFRDSTMSGENPETQEWQPLNPKQADLFLANLRLVEKAKLEAAYDTLNGIDDAEREKVKNGLTPTMTM